MKKYEIELDGEVYHVTIRELAPDTDMTQYSKPYDKEGSPAPNKHTVAPSQGIPVMAPMVGTILQVLVKPGQNVRKGDQLFILEAMKMENEIVAPEDGSVREILVNVNDSVESNQTLLLL